MTDRFNALSALVSSGHELASDALQRFYNLFHKEALVMDKWFALQAGSTDRGGNILSLVRNLMLHPDFHIKNPNRARSLIFSFCSANPGAFHRTDAAGYVFWSERVLELDSFNPQVAARVARSMDRDPKHMQEMLIRSNSHKGASFLEIYQNCNIFNDGAFEIFTEKSTKAESEESSFESTEPKY
jgi:aminopeptidase N